MGTERHSRTGSKTFTRRDGKKFTQYTHLTSLDIVDTNFLVLGKLSYERILIFSTVSVGPKRAPTPLTTYERLCGTHPLDIF